VNHLDKVDRKQAEKQKEERRKEKRERVEVLEAKRSAFEAKMSAGRRLHEEGHLANDALAVAGLLEQLEQPAAEKAKGAEAAGRRRRRLKPLRAEVAPASTPTGAAVEAAPSITAGIAVVSAGGLRKRPHVHHGQSASTGA
jgi:hypothetical protein